jgi:hypothetical protein
VRRKALVPIERMLELSRPGAAAPLDARA